MNRLKILFSILISLAMIILTVIIIVGKNQWSKNVLNKAEAATVASQQLQLETDSKETIIFPQNFYVLQDDNESYETSVYFRNVIKGDAKNVKITSELGEQDDEKWTLKANDKLKPGAYPITFEVSDEDIGYTKIIESQIEVVSLENDDKVNLLSIGDSMTRRNIYSDRVQGMLENVQTVGTRTFDNGVSNGEGRGGWTMDDYLHKFGTISGEDSPFLFPIGVEGDHYKGNTNFWKNVCYNKSTEYEFEGFQKVAANWNKEDCQYDEDGYPVDPNKDDVVFDPNQDSGKQFKQFNGEEWTIMNVQPSYEFSFKKYIDRYEVAFENGKPNMVTLLLGANDFQTTDNIAKSGNYIVGIHTFIESIREYDPDIKFIINLPIVGNTEEVWKSHGVKGTAEQYRENMQMLSSEIINDFDNMENEGVYINATNSVVGLENMDDWVHPKEEGYFQMGESLAALVQKIRNEN